MKREYQLPILGVVNWTALLVLLHRLPDRIPMHWNLRGEIDAWGSKYHLIWIGALPVAMWTLLTVLPALDPKRKHSAKLTPSDRVIRTVVVGMMIAVGWISVAAALSHRA